METRLSEMRIRSGHAGCRKGSLAAKVLAAGRLSAASSRIAGEGSLTWATSRPSLAALERPGAWNSLSRREREKEPSQPVLGLWPRESILSCFRFGENARVCGPQARPQIIFFLFLFETSSVRPVYIADFGISESTGRGPVRSPGAQSAVCIATRPAWLRSRCPVTGRTHCVGLDLPHRLARSNKRLQPFKPFVLIDCSQQPKIMH